VEILVYIDEDDPTRDQYQGDFRLITGPRLRASRSHLTLMGLCETDYMMIGGDDMECRTKDWDKKLISLIPADRIGIAHGDDCWKQSSPSHFVVSKRVYELTGMWPDVFKHFGPDGYIHRVMSSLGRVFYDPTVKIAHLHFRAGFAPVDQTYLDEREGHYGKDYLDKVAAEYEGKDRAILQKEIERLA
jgi:hypothetical protein